MIFCTPEAAEPTYRTSENAVNVVNEVRVDNSDAESLLAIIALMNIILVVALIVKQSCKRINKKYMRRPKEDV